MKSKLLLITMCSVLCSVFFLNPVTADQGAEKAALDSAEKWLVLVDNGSYGQSWDEAAGYLKNALPKQQWMESLQAYRKPLGRLVSRKLISKQCATTLPGAPDGEYVVIQYETSFENKKSAIETITPMLDKDGTWRVSGYFIR
jgi:hypothetical protein